MFEITGFLAALNSKKDLCVQSAAFINQIMSGTTYCRRHINEVIAELIKNYDYDYESKLICILVSAISRASLALIPSRPYHRSCCLPFRYHDMV